MKLKDKLKELRLESGMTQEELAEKLNISSQTVSKWERGLLAPDIMLLPKIAVLFRCSIDSIFDMESSWSVERKKAFSEKIRILECKKDYEGLYRAYLTEIELNPDQYEHYARVGRIVVVGKLFDEAHFERLLLLMTHAEKYCPDADIKHEIYRNMIVISANMKTEKGKIYAEWFYRKLPKLRHSREIYARYVMEKDQLQLQTKRNIMRLTSLLHDEMIQLFCEEMGPEEELFYHQKNISLLETVLDGKYGGYFDGLLLWHYEIMINLFVKAGDDAKIKTCLESAINVFERHLLKNEISPFYCDELPSDTDYVKHLECFLRFTEKRPAFAAYRENFLHLLDQYGKCARK